MHLFSKCSDDLKFKNQLMSSPDATLSDKPKVMSILKVADLYSSKLSMPLMTMEIQKSVLGSRETMMTK